MAQLQVRGVDTTTGEEKLSEAGDTLVASVSVPETVSERKAIIPSVNFGASGTTLLFTVPALKSLLVDEIAIEVTSAAPPTVGPKINVGDNAGTKTECIPNQQVYGLDVVGEVSIIKANGRVKKIAAGASVAIEVTNPANAALVGTVHLFGRYI